MSLNVRMMTFQNYSDGEKVYYYRYLPFYLFFMIKIWFQTKNYSCKFSQKCIVKMIKIGTNLMYLLNYWFLRKFTGILFCSESISNHKKVKII